MARRSRDSLKLKFGQGAMPSSEAFSDLIESMLNIVDQQFDKTPPDGLKVGQFNQGRLLSFYHNIDMKSPIWSIRMDQPGDNLLFGNADFPAALSLHSRNGDAAHAGFALEPSTNDDRQRQGVFELDLKGRVVADGRIGRAGTSVLADGEWHSITPVLFGCQAFEVMAGAGKKDSGKYAVMHAFALNAFSEKGEITYHQSRYGSKCSRIELRWRRETDRLQDGYRLQIRVGCAYDECGRGKTPSGGAPTSICFYLTQLWFDPSMKQCQVKTK
ncbi:MAG: hypothetical protein A3I66_04250 [Burkholderiales bacterium RIFCSPLOWO2_02_FULL_57_36]|nr:MAG: hypothetical protein A3I66_04250 [Burkholderiales bacterium RIFCSPLOWO2_02_FULL_57_36]